MPKVGDRKRPDFVFALITDNCLFECHSWNDKGK